MRIRAVVKGALTFVPGMQSILSKPIASRNPPASYYYGVWLKHVALLAERDLYGAPQSVAELGPGDGLGLGVAALLSGIDTYYGLDVVAHANAEENLRIMNQLVDMFKQRAPRPTKGWPDFDHLLDERLFPGRALTEEQLQASLTAPRIETIAAALRAPDGKAGGLTIAYRAPWENASVLQSNSVDLVLSQAVLEHVTDIEFTYRTLYQWLKPGGIMSHQIDLRSHDLTAQWNGHRAIGEPMWKIMMGKREYLINRAPVSAHLKAIGDCGFEILNTLTLERSDGIPRSRLAPRWRGISDHDLNCAEVLVQARKPLR